MARVADYRTLLCHCIKAISTYDASKLGPDSHIEAYLSSPDLQVVSDHRASNTALVYSINSSQIPTVHLYLKCLQDVSGLMVC